MFTELLENYKEKGLKALKDMVVLKEEPTEDEFNKEIDIAQKKSEGKIRNKKVDNAAVQAVEITPKAGGLDEEEGIDVEELSEEQLIEYEIVKGKDGKYRDDEGNVIKKLNPQQKKYSKRSMWGKTEYVPSVSPKKTNEEVTDIQERKLSKEELDKRERVVKKLKKNMKDFKARYGDKAKSVAYAVATKQAKKDD